MGPPPKLLITVATYNERENLPGLIDQLHVTVPQADVLVVDDNSPDGTGTWATARAATDPQVRCLVRPRKLGVGSATVAALQHALARGYQLVVTMDADGSHNPRDIPRLVAPMQSERSAAPDVVIGSRYIAGGGTVGWPRYRRWMSRSINAFARLALGLPVRDCSGGFRCLRVTLLEQLDLASIRSHGYACLEEILWRCKRAGARFEEVPIQFTNRQHGKSKINARESLAAVWMLGRLGLRNWFTRQATRAARATASRGSRHHEPPGAAS
ncbi:MAG: polyprenol monophosphomannose synthase [Pirellulaceae bacterium]|jgi:dolichol-phosphate mannosyltransferase|nr:polyprenol monophosphomannose synthase [Pirellulaceae bacterium]